MNPNLVYLAQTDTTAGLLSADFKKLNRAKSRPICQNVLMEVASLQQLKSRQRVPTRFKNRIRRSEKTTFIYPTKKSFRLIRDEKHLKFLKIFKEMYSTSANKTGKDFEYLEAYEMCDVVVMDSRGIFSSQASKIFKINHRKIKKIR